MKKIIILFLILFSISSCAKLNLNESYGKPANEVKYEEKLKVHYLDVGEGDSIFIELPNRKCMLIDAGESKYSKTIIDYINNLNYKKIDYLVSTHPHTDHIGGLSKVIESFNIGSIYMPKVVSTTKTYENLLNTIKSKELKIKTGKSGVEIINDNSLLLTIEAPNKDKYSGFNNYSIVLKLVYGNTSFLFMGDAESLSEKEITSDIDVDVLKVGHHGSDTSTSNYLLEKTTPKYAIISVGENSYNHPSSKIINNIKKYTNNIYRTDLNGNVVISSDGKNILIEKEK